MCMAQNICGVFGAEDSGRLATIGGERSRRLSTFGFPASFSARRNDGRCGRARGRAVAAAYGWPEDISIEEALEKLLALNLRRRTRQENRS
jgi:hypothetical protein